MKIPKFKCELSYILLENYKIKIDESLSYWNFLDYCKSSKIEYTRLFLFRKFPNLQNVTKMQ